MGIAFRHEGYRKDIVRDTHRKPCPCRCACGFAFEIVQLIGQIFGRALELINGT